MADIKYERNGIQKMAGERFKDALIAEGWSVVDGSSDPKDKESGMTKKEIMEHLTNLGVEFDQMKKKADLLALLEQSVADDNEDA